MGEEQRHRGSGRERARAHHIDHFMIDTSIQGRRHRLTTSA
jgi:hypothetical protein